MFYIRVRNNSSYRLFSCLFKDKLAGTNCVFPPIRALRSSNTGFAF